MERGRSPVPGGRGECPQAGAGGGWAVEPLSIKLIALLQIPSGITPRSIASALAELFLSPLLRDHVLGERPSGTANLVPCSIAKEVLLINLPPSPTRVALEVVRQHFLFVGHQNKGFTLRAYR